MFLSIPETDTQREAGRFAATFVALALGLFFIVLTASEALIRIRVEPSDLLLQHLQFMAKTLDDKVVLGDSHAALGFTGQPGISNIAFPGENFATTLTKVDTFFATHKPGLVILQVSPHQLRDKRNEGIVRDYRRLGSGEMSLRVMSEWHGSQLLNYWETFLQRRSFGTQRVFQADGAQTSSGRLTDLPAAERENTAQQTVTGQLPPANPAAAVGTQILNRLLDRLAMLGAKVCLVTFPVSPDYRALAASHPEFDETRRFIASLARQRGLTYVDLWKAVDDERLFYNHDHLNHQGAFTVAPRIVAGCGA